MCSGIDAFLLFAGLILGIALGVIIKVVIDAFKDLENEKGK